MKKLNGKKEDSRGEACLVEKMCSVSDLSQKLF